MNGPGPAVVHVSPRVQSRGGIETLLGLNRSLPGDQAFVALFDRDPEVRPGYVNLDCTWRTPLAEMRRRFARAMAPYAGRLVIYHNGWGLPLFHDLDVAGRRAVMLHADPAYHAPDLPGFAGLIDGALAITPAVRTAVEQAFPGLRGGRVAVFPVPIKAPPAAAPRRGSTRLRLGYAGRIERAQKRLDRLPAFLRAMQATGLDFQFELIGDGSYRSALERELAGKAQFHGWVSEEDYGRIMSTWDAVVFFSDHEGGPMALLEGMAGGAIPFYPAQTGSWADLYVPQVDPRCHYPPGDGRALAAAVRDVFQLPEDEMTARREKSRALVAAHTPRNYRAVCGEFIARMQATPRLSQPGGRGGKWTDLLPLGFVTRLAPGLLSQPS